MFIKKKTVYIEIYYCPRTTELSIENNDIHFLLSMQQ